jgi:TetR/AcrR family transcriptional repressor of nem operon
MGFSRAHKQRTHQQILAAASDLFRLDGLEGASIDRIMRAAGHTVGGFYGHFASREEMVVEALARILEQQNERWLGGLGDFEGAAWVDAFLARYLTRENRDRTLCALPAVVPDVGRARGPVRATFALGLAALAAEVEQRAGAGPGAREKALGVIALSFGSLSLARACSGTPLGDELLEAGRRAAAALIASGAPVRPKARKTRAGKSSGRSPRQPAYPSGRPRQKPREMR